MQFFWYLFPYLLFCCSEHHDTRFVLSVFLRRLERHFRVRGTGMVWCCEWKVFCHWAGYLWDQSSQVAVLHFYVSSMCSCVLVFAKLFLHYFYQMCSFCTVFSNWLELRKIIYFLIVLFTEPGGEFTLLLKWKSWSTNVTFFHFWK